MQSVHDQICWLRSDVYIVYIKSYGGVYVYIVYIKSYGGVYVYIVNIKSYGEVYVYIVYIKSYVWVYVYIVNIKSYGGVYVYHRFSFLCYVVVLFCFVCLRPVSCVPNVAKVSGLSILDCPFGFL